MVLVKFCAGNEVGQADDEKLVRWHCDEKSQDELLAEALDWASGRFPASDSEYDAVVWIEGDDGEVIDSETVLISADGEMVVPE